MKIMIIEAPEAKIFQVQYHDILMKNPEKIYTEAKIDIVIPRASGAIKFTLGVPKIIGGPIGSDKEQIPTEIVNFLASDAETDCYGVAALDLADDAFSAYIEMVFTAMANPEAIKKMDFPPDLKKKISEAKDKTKVISKERVYKAIRRNVELAEKQALLFREGKLGEYEPSPCEWLCKYALRKELSEKADDRKKFIAEFDAPLSKGFSAEVGA